MKTKPKRRSPPVRRKRRRRSNPRKTEAYDRWRAAVFERDNFECKICGSTRILQAHHMWSWNAYPKLRFEIANGIVLCRVHHREFHRQYGKGNNTPHQLQEYINTRPR